MVNFSEKLERFLNRLSLYSGQTAYRIHLNRLNLEKGFEYYIAGARPRDKYSTYIAIGLEPHQKTVLLLTQPTSARTYPLWETHKLSNADLRHISDEFLNRLHYLACRARLDKRSFPAKPDSQNNREFELQNHCPLIGSPSANPNVPVEANDSGATRSGQAKATIENLLQQCPMQGTQSCPHYITKGAI